MVTTIDRETLAQLWIEGEITFKGLERLNTMIRFMQEAWMEESAPSPPTESLNWGSEINS